MPVTFGLFDTFAQTAKNQNSISTSGSNTATGGPGLNTAGSELNTTNFELDLTKADIGSFDDLKYENTFAGGVADKESVGWPNEYRVKTGVSTPTRKIAKKGSRSPTSAYSDLPRALRHIKGRQV